MFTKPSEKSIRTFKKKEGYLPEAKASPCQFKRRNTSTGSVPVEPSEFSGKNKLLQGYSSQCNFIYLILHKLFDHTYVLRLEQYSKTFFQHLKNIKTIKTKKKIGRRKRRKARELPARFREYEKYFCVPCRMTNVNKKN